MKVVHEKKKCGIMLLAQGKYRKIQSILAVSFK